MRLALSRFAVSVLLVSAWLPHVSGQPTSVVHPVFDLRSPERSPFPSDRFTVPDPTQNTGRRVNLPMPEDCVAQAAECEDRAVLNQFDGFNMQARISVPFDGHIDPASVTGDSVFLVKLGDALAGRMTDRTRVGINQIVWSPESRELSFRPDVSLDQHTRYALAVTTGVRDSRGNAIGVAEGFRRYRADLARDKDLYYSNALRVAEEAVHGTAASRRRPEIAALSVFTTQSFSHVLERMREAVRRTPAPTLNFAVGLDGARAVFDASQLQSLTNNTDVRVGGPLTQQPLTNAVVNMRLIPGAVGTVAFGIFRALDFTAPGSGHIAAIPTRTGRLSPTRSVDVAFNLWLPAGMPPAGGWPLAICAHGRGVAKNFCFPTAAVLTSHRLAVIAINAMGHGAGPLTTMTAARVDGSEMTFAAPGLGADQNGDGTIAAWEPSWAVRPYAAYGEGGPIVQSAALVWQLVQAIQAGVDVDADGRTDLDASRIYFYGHSLGAMYGMLAFAFDPAIRAAVFVTPTGTRADNRTLAPVAQRPSFGRVLAARTPSLLNSAEGITSIDGVAVPAPHFNDNLPLRQEQSRLNTVTGAVAIQRLVDHLVWAEQTSSTVAIAPYLRRSRPAGVTARPFVIHVARSDQTTTNPTTTQIIRAGELADRVLLYRHDLNFGETGVPADPHLFLTSVQAPPRYSRVALGAQHQIATFFASDGATLTHPAPMELWEVPIKSPLPEDLFFLPRPR